MVLSFRGGMGGAGAVLIEEGQYGNKIFLQPEPKNGDAKTYTSCPISVAPIWIKSHKIPQP